MDLCVGLDVIIAGTMDAMAGITDAAAVDAAITTDAAAGIPSAKASARDTGRDTMMLFGTAAAVAVTVMAAVVDAAVTAMAAVADAAVTVMAVVAVDAVAAAISPYALMPLPA